MTDEAPLRAGVVGVGSMGQNHARVYRELAAVDLVGVADVDADAAERVAREYGTTSFDTDRLLRRADLVSVAAPTPAHAPLVEKCIDAGVHVLVEKPFVTDLDAGRELALRARQADVVLQVGHIERFNPAVRTLVDLVEDLDVIAVDANRVGPPVDRDLKADVVFDLMIHDLDVVASILGTDPTSVAASTTAELDYATACVEFGDVPASFTASRVTQQKVRRLGITARECRVVVDYIEQSLEIHRSAKPAYIEENGDVRHSIESVVERPIIGNGEPLKGELSSFVEAVRDGEDPIVTAEDGLRAVALSQRILAVAADRPRKEVAR